MTYEQEFKVTAKQVQREVEKIQSEQKRDSDYGGEIPKLNETKK